MAADLPDWVKGVSPGGGLLSLSVGVVAPGGVGFSNVVNVAGYSELWLTTVATNGAGTARLVLAFYADQAATKPTAPGMVWFKNTRVATYMVVPVLGPWVQLEYDNNDVANTTAGGSAFAVATPFEIGFADVLGSDPVLLANGVNLGANGVMLPSKMVSGKAKFWYLDNASANQFVSLQVWDGAAWRFFNQTALAALGTNQSGEVGLPLSDWRAVVSLASTNMFASLTPVP